MFNKKEQNAEFHHAFRIFKKLKEILSLKNIIAKTKQMDLRAIWIQVKIGLMNWKTGQTNVY